MDFSIKKEQQTILETAGKLAREELFPRAADIDIKSVHPTASLAEIWRKGLLGITIPKEYGGLGLGLLESTMVLEKLAAGCASTTASFHTHTVVQRYIDALGNVEQKEELFSEVINEGKLFGSWGSEPGTHGGAAPVKVVVNRAKEGYVMNGPKHFCTMAGACNRAMVHANIPDKNGNRRTIMVMVPTESQGLAIIGEWNTLGMRGTVSPAVTFNNCFIAENALLGQPGDVEKKGIEQTFALGDAAIYIGIAQGALDWFKEYAKSHAFNPNTQPLSHDLLLQRRVAKMTQRLEGARYVLYSSCQGYWEETNMGRWYLVSKAKYLASQASMFVANMVAEGLGGRIAHRRYPIERMIRDIRTATLMPPSPDRCLEVIAKYELGIADDQLASRWGTLRL
jgi:alkylation response protein AidB-like acyl-CoA dehydrogenase